MIRELKALIDRGTSRTGQKAADDTIVRFEATQAQRWARRWTGPSSVATLTGCRLSGGQTAIGSQPAMKDERGSTSKFLSLVLRHRPETIGVTLDPGGWVAVDELLAACSRHGRAISREQLDEIVRTSDKGRFALSPDGLRIRANQGHSIPVDLGLVPVEPPALRYHGTVERFLPSIRQSGLVRGKRHHVHLSADAETARRVGQRRGRPVILVVEAGRMSQEGHIFFRSENGVWLTETVPAGYLRMPEEKT